MVSWPGGHSHYSTMPSLQYSLLGRIRMNRIKVTLLGLLAALVSIVPSFADGTPPAGFTDAGTSVSGAIGTLTTQLGAIGGTILTFVLLGVGIFFAIKWLKRGAKAA
jgi:hypothetical protein